MTDPPPRRRISKRAFWAGLAVIVALAVVAQTGLPDFGSDSTAPTAAAAATGPAVEQSAIERSLARAVGRNAPPATHGDGVAWVRCGTDNDRSFWTCDLHQEIAGLPDVTVTYAIVVRGNLCWAGTLDTSSGDDSLFDTGDLLEDHPRGCIRA